MGKSALIIVVFLLIGYGCSNQNIALGKWKTKAEKHEFVVLTEKDAQILGEAPPAPPPSDNKLGWKRVKEVGKSPENIKPNLKPYSVSIVESGFIFLQSTRRTDKNHSYDDIEWGWKAILENRSKRDIYAYGGYSLFDKNGFILTSTGAVFDNNESGVCIKAGEKGIVQGRGLWRVDVQSNPYPPSRVYSGDYKLFLRHDELEDLWDKVKNNNTEQRHRAERD